VVELPVVTLVKCRIQYTVQATHSVCQLGRINKIVCGIRGSSPPLQRLNWFAFSQRNDPAVASLHHASRSMIRRMICK
jgi:hypothetical protein